MLSGITPDMKVLLALRKLRLTKLPMAEGILPEILVSCTLSICMVVERFTVEIGIFPVKASLSLINNCWSWLQFDIAVMNPHPSLLSASSSFLNRGFPPFPLPEWKYQAFNKVAETSSGRRLEKKGGGETP